MRIRIRGPEGQSTATLPDDATVGDLQAKIREFTSLPEFSVKFGFPPEPLGAMEFPPDSRLADWGVKLNGETLIISPLTSGGIGVGATSQGSPIVPPLSSSAAAGSDSGSVGDVPPATTNHPSKSTAPATSSSLSTASAAKDQDDAATDPPEVPVPTRAATLVLRIMPDDNSCLFRAFNSAFFGVLDNMHELRSIIAQTIQARPDDFSAAVLGKERDAYCRWITTSDAWGGAIELLILAQHFDIEICSIDVQTGRIDRFGEEASSGRRCVLVYSGIHYDVVALSPNLGLDGYAVAGEDEWGEGKRPLAAPPEFDEKVFDKSDDDILEYASALCAKLRQQHYYTDTAAFAVRCNVCGGTFRGDKGATEHARQTGHYDFGEV